MDGRLCFVVVALEAGCIEPPSLRAPPTPARLVSVETPTGDLDALARVATLSVRFDRPMEWPAEGSVMLVAGEASEALRGDASDGVLSATSEARRVPVRLWRDARDPSTIGIEAGGALLPDARLTLLLTPVLRGADGSPLEAPDGGSRTRSLSLAVAPARRLGALPRAEVVDPGEAPLRTARVYVRFDRAVRGRRGEAPLGFSVDGGATVSSRASLDCFDTDGFARCGWIEPSVTLRPLTAYRVTVAPLLARNGSPPERARLLWVTGPREDAPRTAFAQSPVCASDESAVGSFCARVSDRRIELRASTTRAAVVRVTARAPNGLVSVAIGASATLHAVGVPVAFAGSSYGLTVEAIGSDGRVHEARAVSAVRTAPMLPRVRVTEVVARPRSTSAQEYVELLNEGSATVDLTGYALTQGASGATLPEGSIIAPGARALVVGTSFDPRGVPSRGDPAVTPGTRVFTLRNSAVGLRDGGSDLTLRDPHGYVMSFVPGADPSRAPRAGVGLVRADTELSDDDIAAWTYDALDGCTPGAPDRVR